MGPVIAARLLVVAAEAFRESQAPFAVPLSHGFDFAGSPQELSGVGTHRLQQAIARATSLALRLHLSAYRAVDLY
jgi:hypothetical protein